MALDPNRWTLKTQEAFNRHRAGAGEQQPRGHPRPPARRAAPPGGGRRAARSSRRRPAAPLGCATAADEAVSKLPKAYGSDVRLSRETSADPRRRPIAARSELSDEYLSTEHLLLALADRLGVSREDLLGGPAGGARQPPGHQPEPRGAVPGAREVRPRPHRGGAPRASSTRSSAATTRSAASSRCCRAARRTTRCSSASPASARPPSSRASPGASSRATCPRA